MTKFVDGVIEKGHMENDERHGTWEWYYPPSNIPGYNCKKDYLNGKEVSDNYDIVFEIDDGFHRVTQEDGTIIEANYAGGKQYGQLIVKFADGVIEKGHMKNSERHGTWEFYFPAKQGKRPAFLCKQDYDNGAKVGKRYDRRDFD